MFQRSAGLVQPTARILRYFLLCLARRLCPAQALFIYAAGRRRPPGVLAEASRRVRSGRGQASPEPVAGRRCSLRMAKLRSRLSQLRTAVVLRVWARESLEDGGPGGAGFFYDAVPASEIAATLLLNGSRLHEVQLLNPVYPDILPGAVSVQRLPPDLARFSPGLGSPYIFQYSLGVDRALRK